MNKQKFIEFLQKPAILNEQNLSELDDMVNENPYFHAARMLEAIGNRSLKTSEAGKKTASAAIYSTNRLLLKKYLAGGVATEPLASAPKPQPAKEIPKPVSTAPTPEPTKITAEPAQQISESPGSSSIDQLIYSLKKDMQELEHSRAKYIEVTRKIEEDEAVEQAVKKATASTDADTKKPAKKAPVKKSTIKKAPAAKKAAGTSTTKASTAKKSTAAAQKKKKTSSGTAKSTANKKTPARKRTATKTATNKSRTTTTKTAAKKQSTAKAKTTKSTAAKTAAKKSSSKASGTTISNKEDNDKGDQQNLIDQFIKKNPSFKPATANVNQEDLSVGSISLNDDIASEYLAEIFLEQGKKDNAIKIYNSLMLRFPEKRAYFAGRIKKIK